MKEIGATRSERNVTKDVECTDLVWNRLVCQ